MNPTRPLQFHINCGSCNGYLPSPGLPYDLGQCEGKLQLRSMEILVLLCLWRLCASLCGGSFWKPVGTMDYALTLKIRRHITSTLQVPSKLKCVAVCSMHPQCKAAGVSKSAKLNYLECSLVVENLVGQSIYPSDNLVVYRLAKSNSVLFATPLKMKTWHDRNKCSCSLPEGGTSEASDYLYVTQITMLNRVALYLYNEEFETFDRMKQMNTFGPEVRAFIPDSSHCRLYWMEKMQRRKIILTSCLNGSGYQELKRGHIQAFGVDKENGRLLYTLKERGKFITYMHFPSERAAAIHHHGRNFKGNCFDIDSVNKFFFWCEREGAKIKIRGRQFDSTIQVPKTHVNITLNTNIVPKLCVASYQNLYWIMDRSAIFNLRGSSPHPVVTNCQVEKSSFGAQGCALHGYVYLACYQHPKYQVYFFNREGENLGSVPLPETGGAILMAG